MKAHATAIEIQTLCDLVSERPERVRRACRRLDDGAARGDALVRLARDQWVAGLVHGVLKDLDADPAGVRTATRRAYERCAAMNIVRLGVLEGALAALEEVGVATAVLKGAHLIELVYGGDPGRRHMTDIDILVAPSRWGAAEAALLSAGFRYRDAASAPLFPTLQLVRDGVVLELHRSLARVGRLDVDASLLLARSTPFSLDGSRARGLAVEDLLLHLAVHLAQHAYLVRLREIVDIAALVRRHPPDWDLLLWRARDWGASFALHLALEMAAELLAAPVPAEVRKPRPGDALRRWWYRALVDHGGLRFSRLPPGRLADILLTLPSVDSPGTVARMVSAYVRRKALGRV